MGFICSGAKTHTHTGTYLGKCFQNYNENFSDFVTKYIPVGPKAPEPLHTGYLDPTPLILGVCFNSILKIGLL